mmetsp:Transcript_33258/g.54938  ORF Transcript_33258/g.54938 Transcript_33258/m.54938 type:complete len:384 (+) Transcript_33258:29-1180(+)
MPGCTACASLAVYIVSCIALGEMLQAAERAYDRPLVLRFLQMACAILLLPLGVGMFPPPRFRRCIDFICERWRPILVLTALIFAGGVLYTLALMGTSVGVCTALTRTRPIFIYILSRALGMAKSSKSAVVAIGFTAGGISLLLIAGVQSKKTSSATHANESWWGVVMTLITSFVWAASDLYTQHCATRHFEPSLHPLLQMFVFQAATGLWDIIAFWPVPLLAALAQSKPPLQAPQSTSLPLIVGACVSLVLTNVSAACGIACSSALFMGVGSLLAIPAAFVCDYLIHAIVPDAYSLCGATMVLVAFLILTCTAAREGSSRSARTPDAAGRSSVSESCGPQQQDSCPADCPLGLGDHQGVHPGERGNMGSVEARLLALCGNDQA